MSDEGHGDPPCGTTGRDIPPELVAEPTDWRHAMRAEIRRLQLEVARLTRERDDKYVFLAGLERRLDEWRAAGAAAEMENDGLKAEVERLTGERDEAREGRAALQRECDEWQERWDAREERRPAAIVPVGAGDTFFVHAFEDYEQAHAFVSGLPAHSRWKIIDTDDGQRWQFHHARPDEPKETPT